MKNIIKLAVLAVAFVTINVRAEIFPKVVPVQFKTGYIPVGFDTNDNAQIVAEGIFPNTCYKPVGVKVVVNHDSRTIKLYPKAFKYKGGVCLQMVLPFNREIDVGLLRAGTYKVTSILNSEENEMGNLQVGAATNSEPDDFLYAPVSQAYFSKADGKYYVTVSGNFPQSCYRMREVVVRVQSNVLVVQPIAERDDGPCEERLQPYSQSVEVKNVKEGRYLLHVRSLNGKAFNNLIDVL